MATFALVVLLWRYELIPILWLIQKYHDIADVVVVVVVVVLM